MNKKFNIVFRIKPHYKNRKTYTMSFCNEKTSYQDPRWHSLSEGPI